MKEDRKIKNVVLIMLDTLQFNYLGCYGNKVVKTPNIDRLARQGFLFENAYSEGLLNALAAAERAAGKKVGVMATEETKTLYRADIILSLGSRAKPEEIA